MPKCRSAKAGCALAPSPDHNGAGRELSALESGRAPAFGAATTSNLFAKTASPRSGGA